MLKKIISFIALPLALTFSMQAFAESPMKIDGATTVDSAKAKELFDKEVAFVDMRKQSDWMQVVFLEPYI